LSLSKNLRNDIITYNQKRILSFLGKKEPKDVPAVAVKLPAFMFLKEKKKFLNKSRKKKIFKKFIGNKKREKRKVLQISLDEKVV